MGVRLVRMEVKNMATQKTVESVKDAIIRALKDVPSDVAAEALTEAVIFQSTLTKPAEALKFARAVGGKVEKRTKDISAAIIASVNGLEGAYDGFTVVKVDGRSSVDVETLHSDYPDVYDKVVRWGNPYFTVRIPSKKTSTEDGSN